jgi:probable phosphoglycerate mutase
MTFFLLVRHGSTDALGSRLTGRLSGFSLNQEGKQQAARLADSLSTWPLSAVYSSPLSRAQETAAALAAPHRLNVVERASLTDLDFGAWSGVTLQKLREDPVFAAFNSYRPGTPPPGGEHAIEAQSRVVLELLALRALHPSELIVVVGHLDPLRSALAFFLGVALVQGQALQISPGSGSLLELRDDGTCLHFLNADAAGLRRGAPTHASSR